MEIFLYVLLLLVAIFISNLINRFVPFVSVPLIQIGLGVLIALFPLSLNLKLNPELFLVMFIAPLLYNDGRRTDKQALWHLRSAILVLALGLVFITVLVIGYFVHWMIPTIPLAAAFALAAALAPTDAVAVSSLSGRINLPKRIMHLLEGEALMNDASGLVAFQFAIAAMVTGAFSLFNASYSFVIIAIGGILVGIVITYLKIKIIKWVRSLGMEDVTFHMLIQILTPFLIYLAAEELHVSGILAVVAAGIMDSMQRKKTDPQLVRLNMVSQSTWSVILFVLNGLVFLILGTQLPSIMQAVWNDSGISNLQVFTYIILITVALILLRFIWVYSFWLANWRKKQLGGQNVGKPRIRSAILTSLSGVRGAVTLASSLSIPFVLADGSAFPQRALIISIASGVILCSLLIATFILPLLAKSDDKTADDRVERAIRIKILRNVIRELHEQITPENKAATEIVVEDYRRRIYDLQQNNTSLNRRVSKEERDKRLELIDWQRENTQRMTDNGEISAAVSYRYQHYLNLLAGALKNRFRFRVKTTLKFLKRILRFILHPKNWQETKSKAKNLKSEQEGIFQEIQRVRVSNEELVVQRLKDELKPENESWLAPLITEHIIALKRANNERKPFTTRGKFEQKKREVQQAGFQAERDEIQQFYEAGKMSRDLVRELRQNINMLETYLSEEELA